MSIAVAPNNMAHQSGHQVLTPAQRLASVNEETWLQVASGKVAEMMSDLDRAMAAYESALRHNPYSIPAMNQIATILRAREQFPRAVEYFQSILNLDQNNGETWGSLGHCYLMMDDLQKAYSAYQQALYHLQNPKEPKLWYGIGILYDRYGSLEHAEEAFSQVMRMDATFDKANEIYFRLGIIYKQQHKYSQSLECFNYIISNPPKPLTEVDIWFQIGHVYEQQKEYGKAKDAYERVLRDNPDHAKVLQQLGWLYHQQSSEFADQDLAIQYLTKSLESDGADAQSWYLLGRCYMAQRKYNKAYEAYQQAVYRDGRNPTFWCSIGVLYYQINQYRDALDAYSRAIRLNPYISEVWYDLGTLYESCNNQVSDALDAYSRAAELDPGNPHIKSRLELLRSGQSSGARSNQAGGPHPQDIHPNAYQNAPQGPPHQWNGQQSASAHNHNPPPPLQQQQHQHPPQHQHHQQQSQQQHQAPPSSQQHQQSHSQQSHHQSQQPAHNAHQHSSAQSQSSRSGPSTPAQPPFRPPEIQTMRPPHSPDRVKQQNGSRSSFAKPDNSAHYQSHSHQSQTHQSPYSSSLPAQTHNPPTPSTPMGGNNLAPILGRTSPVSEIKSLASRDDGNAPREQASTPVPGPHQSNRPLTPVPINRDGDSASLKRPREWEDQSSAPEPKKQDTSGPAAQQSPQHERRSESGRATPIRESGVRDSMPPTPAPIPTPAPRAPSESPSHGNNNHGNVHNNNSNHQSSNSSNSNGAAPEAAAEPENVDGPSVPATTSANGSPPGSVHSEQKPAVSSELETPTAGAETTEKTSSASSVAPENAERKVELDENYDDEEE